MGCYLDDYRARVGTWAGRFSLRATVGQMTRGGNNYAVTMNLCATVIAALLVIGGVELNPGPVDNIMQVLCSGCDRNLKSGTQCDSCGQWYHNSCGNVKIQAAVSGKWICDKCRSERLRELEEKLRVAQAQTEELTRMNRALEEQLRLVGNGGNVVNRDTEEAKNSREKCLVLGDSIVRNVGVENSDMRVKCFPGIKTEQLRRVIENRGLGCADAVVIYVGTNGVRSYKNLDYVMGEADNLVNTAKAKFPESRLIISGVLRSKGVSWRCVGMANDRLDWVAGTLGATFVDLNSWIRDEDYSRDGLHLTRKGTRKLGELYYRVYEREV